jgi:solute carrier family 25 protein 44
MPDSASTPIEWSNINKPKFFGLGSLLFFLVRVVVYPASLIKTRLQLETTARTSALRTFIRIIKVEGARSLYQGFPLSASGAVPAQMVYLSIYESSKQYFGKFLHGDISKNLAAGMCASVASQVIVVPV